VWRVPPWELEEQLSSAWFTRMIAFENEFTLDPIGWRQTAQTNYLQAVAFGDKRSKPKDFMPRVKAGEEQQSDQQIEMLLRAFAKKKKKKKE
jgi:hypothetical protein